MNTRTDEVGWTAGAGVPVGWRADLVLFDLDDTLCDYAGARDLRLRTAFAAALATTARDDRLPADMDQLIAASIAVQPHGADHFADLLGPLGVSRDASEAATRWYRTNRFHGLRLFDDAVETLRAIRTRTPGRPIGLVTNGPAETQRAKIALLEIGGLIDFAVVSGEFGVEKPHPTIFHEALRLGGAAAAATVFVGDSPVHDIAGAMTAGMRAVWVNRTGSAWPLDEPAPHATVGRLTEVFGVGCGQGDVASFP